MKIINSVFLYSRDVLFRSRPRLSLLYPVQHFHTISKMNSKSLRQALLLSSSNCHGYTPLEFAKQEICDFFKGNAVKEVVFIPYAQKDYDSYTNKIKQIIEPWGYSVTGLHTFSKASDAVKSAKAIFVGGGNTFLLLKTLYENNLVELIRKRVLEEGLLYMGASAGTNVATKSINTTNDMPITYPPSFEAIQLVPFNINPHYIDKLESETHRGETRDQRIQEYLEQPDCGIVVGLKEGALLHLNGNSLLLKGVAGAVLFSKDGKKTEYPVGADLSFLL